MRSFSNERPTHTTASGTNEFWTFTFEPEPKRTIVHRLAIWYWVTFVMPDRCLCHIGLGRVCDWLEGKACG